MSDRRSFLRGLASLPLIGGGITLIGVPSAPVALSQIAATPHLHDPRERARYAWEAFSSAMRDITAGDHGWWVTGGEKQPFGYVRGFNSLMLHGITYAKGVNPDCPSLIVERHRDIEL